MHLACFAGFVALWLAHAVSTVSLVWLVPLGHLFLGITLHSRFPSTSDMRRFVRKTDEMPHYRDEKVSEKLHGYSRHVHKVPSSAKMSHDASFVLVTPTSRGKDLCLLWVGGYGRYFSHTSARGDFPEADWCGLDLPHYGRAYAEDGYDAVGNELMSVAEPATAGTKFVEYYYGAYQAAIDELGALGYKRVVFMCNSTAGLTFQCFATDVLSQQQQQQAAAACSVAGVIYTAPFWTSTSPAFRNVPYGFWRGLAWLFPKLILFCDDVMPSGEPAAHDKRLQAARASGRDVYLDPYLNPTDNAPYYVEWFCMVMQAQCHLQSAASKQQQPARQAASQAMPCALLITTAKQECEPYVHLDECHALFNKLHPRGEAHFLHGVNHEVMLSEQKPYQQALIAINAFLKTAGKRGK